MAERTFTLDEAQSLLSVLESLLRTAIKAKKIVDEADAEQQALQHRVFLNGGMFLDIVPLARRKAERTKAEQRVKDALAVADWCHVLVAGRMALSCPAHQARNDEMLGAVMLGGRSADRPAAAEEPPS